MLNKQSKTTITPEIEDASHQLTNALNFESDLKKHYLVLLERFNNTQAELINLLDSEEESDPITLDTSNLSFDEYMQQLEKTSANKTKVGDLSSLAKSLKKELKELEGLKYEQSHKVRSCRKKLASELLESVETEMQSMIENLIQCFALSRAANGVRSLGKNDSEITRFFSNFIADLARENVAQRLSATGMYHRGLDVEDVIPSLIEAGKKGVLK